MDVSLTVAVAPKDYIAATKPMLHTNTCKYRAALETLAKVVQGSSPICGPLLPVIPPLALAQSLIPFPVISLSCLKKKAMKGAGGAEKCDISVYGAKQTKAASL